MAIKAEMARNEAEWTCLQPESAHTEAGTCQTDPPSASEFNQELCTEQVTEHQLDAMLIRLPQVPCAKLLLGATRPGLMMSCCCTCSHCLVLQQAAMTPLRGRVHCSSVSVDPSAQQGPCPRWSSSYELDSDNLEQIHLQSQWVCQGDMEELMEAISILE